LLESHGLDEIQLLLESHGLDEIAKERCVEISPAIDAAPLTKTLSIVTLGIVLSNIATIDPVTKKPICVETIGGQSTRGVISFLLYLYGFYMSSRRASSTKTGNIVKSRELCFPLCMIIGHETKENIRIFKYMYKELKSYEQDKTSINHSYKALKVHHKGYMSA
jgi:hypothetical protein